jgi:phosphohistidine phosphatase
MAKVKFHKKTLYLMRHATANMDADSDFERPLTATGERDARHMGRWLHDKYPAPDQVVASPALRAKTTASIVIEELHQQHPIHFEEELYEASVRTFLEIVTSLSDDMECVIIVAHNPAITYLADYLTTEGLEGMRPGAIVGLGFELEKWCEISQHDGALLFTMTPDQL